MRRMNQSKSALLGWGAAILATAGLLSVAPLTSSASSPAGRVSVVGAPTTFAAPRSARPTTSMPAGATAGDVLVSYVETYATARVECGVGSRRVLDQVDSRITRLVACITLVGSRTDRIGALVSPPSQVSMVTEAFRGVDPAHPVAARAATAGLISPALSQVGTDDEVVFGEGSSGWQARAAAVGGQKPAASTNDHADSQVALASTSVGSTVSQAARWALAPLSVAPVAGAVVLNSRHHHSGALPPPVPTTTAPPVTAPTTNPVTPVTPAPTTTTTLAPPSATTTVGPSPTTQAPTTSPASTAPTTPTGSSGTAGSSGTGGGGQSQQGAPSTPPATVCGDSALLSGPASAPSGAVTIPAGLDSGNYSTAGTTYWFAPGTHTLGTGMYDEIAPARGDVYIGAPGAILSGQGDNNYAFFGASPDVTVEDLTIEGFVPPGQEAAVNQNGAPGWTIENDTVTGNSPGAGVMLGTDNVLTGNCLSDNGQYGFQAYSDVAGTLSALTGGPSNVTVTDNEITGNDTYNWESVQQGCGCSGGAKFWEVDGATVEDNYVHDNHNVGLWADTDNTGFTIEGNYVSGNYGQAIMYEISYNAVIDDNTLIDNGWGAGESTKGWEPALYVSESGGDSRVPGPNSGVFDIEGNVLTNNWGGIDLWENANRFCSDGSDGACTLVAPSTYTLASCGANLAGSTPSGSPDYFDNCRWKTQNVTVSGNTLDLDPSVIGSACTAANSCGLTGLFSESGSVNPFRAWVVPEDISNRQDDVFKDNTYAGPWQFDAFTLGEIVTWAQWTHGFTDRNGSNFTIAGQDAGSTWTP